jgi:hypothetical protein
MADKSSALVQGTLDMLILKALDLEPMHGNGISARASLANEFWDIELDPLLGGVRR